MTTLDILTGDALRLWNRVEKLKILKKSWDDAGALHMEKKAVSINPPYECMVIWQCATKVSCEYVEDILTRMINCDTDYESMIPWIPCRSSYAHLLPTGRKNYVPSKKQEKKAA